MEVLLGQTCVFNFRKVVAILIDDQCLGTKTRQSPLFSGKTVRQVTSVGPGISPCAICVTVH